MKLEKRGNRGPFLVVAPLSTLIQWEREFEIWTDLNVINFCGRQKSKQIIMEYEMWFDGRKDICKFEVMLTNYDKIRNSYDLFQPIKWEYLVIDEAHNMKNSNSKLYQLMQGLSFAHCLLMTGTPIQNSLEELWSLLHFISSRTFPSYQDFCALYPPEMNADSIQLLREKLKHWMFRRKKSEVDSSIAQKEETIVKVELTRTQKFLYRMLMDNKVDELMRGSAKVPSLMNLMMQLRKVCNHPYLINGGESSVFEKAQNHDELLVKCCGKLMFVDKLLQKLKKEGTKVLIFFSNGQGTQLVRRFLKFTSLSL